jgi:hypothetical protein
MYRGGAAAFVIIFLTSVARFYHQGTGFTALLAMPAGHEYETPAFRAVPHYDYPAWASYDGQFYVQLALDPLLRDPATRPRHGSGPVSGASDSLQLDGVPARC